ncbi:hypothetical protein [Lentzea sp. E54]|uniref:hypothetical protein n=1 Tax=Lentzea xerophila TaxID=3435883 RepID=UPI003DA436A5
MGGAGSADTCTIPEAQGPACARGLDDLSVHEVAMDTGDSKIAYIAYDAGGFRVVEYGRNRLGVGAQLPEPT